MRRCAVASLCVCLLLACSRDNAEDHFKSADSHLAAGRLHEAIIEYQIGLTLEPTRGAMRLKLAEAHLRNSDAGAAAKEYIRAADLLPNDAATQLKAGTMLILAGKFEDAQARARKALAAEPLNVQARILLGNALAGVKDIESAVLEYQRALTLDPGEHTAYENIALLNWAQRNTETAEANYRQAIAVAPDATEPKLAFANFLWLTGRAKEAEDLMLTALDADRVNVSLNRALGAMYIATGRATEAERFFQAIAKSRAANGDLSLADYYVIVGRPKDARVILDQHVSARGRDAADAQIRLAAMDIAQQMYANAATRLRQVLDADARNGVARVLLARALMAQSRRDEAMAEAQRVISEQPDSDAAPAAYSFLGAVYASLDRRSDAIRMHEEVLKRRPKAFTSELALAALYLADGSTDKAAASLQGPLKAAPDNVVVRTLKARIALRNGNLIDAQRELASLKKESPVAPAILTLEAEERLAAGKPQEARALYAKVSAANAADVAAFAALIHLDVIGGRSQQALDALNARLKNDQTWEMLMVAGETYRSLDPNKAEEYLELAIQSDPSRLRAYDLLGKVYLQQRRFDVAAQQFQKLIERDPSSSDAHLMLAAVYERASRPSDAEQEYQRALKIDPRSAIAANNLAWMYASTGRELEKALALAQTAVEQRPDDPRMNDTLGWVYHLIGLSARGIPHLERSAKADPDAPSTHFHLGMAYSTVGRFDEARKALEHALASRQPFPEEAQARSELSKISG